MGKRRPKATKLILINLQFPKTKRELASIVYPKTKYEYCKGRIRKHLRVLDDITITKKKYILVRKGEKKIENLIRNFWIEIIEEIKVPKYIVDGRDSYFENEMYKFQDEVLNFIDVLLNDDPINIDKNLENIVKKVLNVEEGEILALNKNFLKKARKIIKDYSVPSNGKVYQIDVDKVFKLFVETNEIPKRIVKKIDKDEFKYFLINWLIKGVRNDDIIFTRRNVMKVITEYLKTCQISENVQWQNFCEMRNFLLERFSVEIKLEKTKNNKIKLKFIKVAKRIKST